MQSTTPATLSMGFTDHSRLFKNLRFLLYSALRHDGYTDQQIKSVNSAYDEEFETAFIHRYGDAPVGAIPTIDIIKALHNEDD